MHSSPDTTAPGYSNFES